MDLSSPGAIVPVRCSPLGRPQEATLRNGTAATSVSPGAQVVVETESGVTLGVVTPPMAPCRRSTAAAPCPVKVLRIATPEDLALRRRHREREAEAYRVGLMKVRERGLAMKLARVEQLFDGSRLVFYFTAEGRVDFRDLVRELASDFRTRIEMRQIGVRDEARMLGGYGSCGRPLCCATWLQSFEPVSIRMAKQQDLSLNPSKLSGLCGRLKCCLRYEMPENALKGVKGDRLTERLDEVPPDEGAGR
jgi:cell fate regulator YaaT (PSP1 superfamily)